MQLNIINFKILYFILNCSLNIFNSLTSFKFLFTKYPTKEIIYNGTDITLAEKNIIPTLINGIPFIWAPKNKEYKTIPVEIWIYVKFLDTFFENFFIFMRPLSSLYYILNLYWYK